MQRLAGALVVVVAVLLVACQGDGEPPPSVTPTAASTGEEEEARRDQFERLVRTIDRGHPDPFHAVDEAAWWEAAESLTTDLASLDDPQALVAVARLANLGAADGHAGLFPFAQAELVAWPLWLYDFDVGLTLVAARDGVDVPLGSRLVAIGDVAIDHAVAAVWPLVPGDNEHSRRARLPSYLVVPVVLEGLGLLDPATSHTLTWELPDGERAQRPAPSPIPMPDFADWLGAFQPQVPPSLPPDDDSPLLTLRHRDEPFWWTRLDSGEVYLGYHRIQAAGPDGTLRDLVDEIRAEVTARPPRRLVVDIRHNPGGENDTSRPLVEFLAEVEGQRPGTVRVLIGRSTFSAAVFFLAALDEEVDVTTVGEPTGGAVNLFGRTVAVRLDALGALVHVATRHEEFFPGDPRLTIEPDVAVATTWDDLAAGRDPVLDAALR